MFLTSNMITKIKTRQIEAVIMSKQTFSIYATKSSVEIKLIRRKAIIET